MSYPPEKTPLALIPIRATKQSKTRLENVLDPFRRRELVLRLCSHLMKQFSNLDSPVEYGVVSEGEDVADIVVEHGGFVWPEPAGAETLGDVVDGALKNQLTDSSRGVLVMPVDLPRVRTGDLATALEAVRDSEVSLVPDDDGQGTNLLWRRPGDRIPCQYEGTASFDDHLSACRKRGIDPSIHRWDHFQFDLDTPEDWHRLLQDPHSLSEPLQSFIADFMIDLNPTSTS